MSKLAVVDAAVLFGATLSANYYCDNTWHAFVVMVAIAASNIIAYFHGMRARSK